MNALILVFLLLIGESRAACLLDSAIPGLNKSVSEVAKPADVRAVEDAIGNFDSSIRAQLPTDHELVIQLEAMNPRVNADITKVGQELIIKIMGGMITHPNMKPDVLQLLLCHEIGHFLGGPPLKSRGGWSSTEGQADYYTGLNCARVLGFDEQTFLDASLKLTRIYAEVVREPFPDLNRCEERVAERTNYGYPSVQCRLDTLMAGWNQQDRPRCWYRD